MKKKVAFESVARFTDSAKVNSYSKDTLQGEQDAIRLIKTIVPLLKGSIHEKELLKISVNGNASKTAIKLIEQVNGSYNKNFFTYIEREDENYILFLEADVYDTHKAYVMYADFLPIVKKWNQTLYNLMIKSISLMHFKYNFYFTERGYADPDWTVENLESEMDYAEEASQSGEDVDNSFYDMIREIIKHYQEHDTDTRSDCMKNYRRLTGNTLQGIAGPEMTEHDIITSMKNFKPTTKFEEMVVEGWMKNFIKLIDKFDGIDMEYYYSQARSQCFGDDDPYAERDGDPVMMEDVFGYHWFGDSYVTDRFLEQVADQAGNFGEAMYRKKIPVNCPEDMQKPRKVRNSKESRFFRQLETASCEWNDIREIVMDNKNRKSTKHIVV